MVLEKQRTMLHGNPVYSSESYDNIRWSESSHYYWPAPMKSYETKIQTHNYLPGNNYGAQYKMWHE